MGLECLCDCQNAVVILTSSTKLLSPRIVINNIITTIRTIERTGVDRENRVIHLLEFSGRIRSVDVIVRTSFCLHSLERTVLNSDYNNPIRDRSLCACCVRITPRVNVFRPVVVECQRLGGATDNNVAITTKIAFFYYDGFECEQKSVRQFYPLIIL